MPTRTIALIATLAVSVIVLLLLATSPWKTNQSNQPIIAQVTPTPNPAHTMLSLSPNPLMISSTTPSQASVDVIIDTGSNVAEAVQLQLLYDPSVVTNVKVTPATTFFETTVELLNSVDQQKGTIDLALGIAPGTTGKQGIGTIATITFTALLPTGKTTTFSFTPKRTMVTQTGTQGSVLKSWMGVTLIGKPQTTTSFPVTNPTIPAQ